MTLFRNLKLSQQLKAGYIIILSLMTLISIVVYISITSIIDASKWVNHTYEVIRTGENLAASMVDMETGQRGFMVTGKEEYLEPYIGGQNNFKALLAKGQKLTSDNPSQGVRWKEVAVLKNRWLKEVAEPEINARRTMVQQSVSLKQIAELMANGKGKLIMDATRAKILEIVQAEEVLIAIRGDEQKDLQLLELNLRLLLH